MSAPRVSVVMNCLNGERYLRQALDSVFAQTYHDWEIVFWDNAGTDASGDIAKSYGEKVRVFGAESTTSLGQARNLAFARARGELVAMLDVDDLWEPEKLALQVAAFDADPGLALVYCDATLFGESGNERTLFACLPHASGRCFAELLAGNFICTGTMLFKASALAGVSPLFEPDLHMVMDYYLTLRLAYDHPLGVVERPLVRHRIHAASESSRNWRRFSSELALMLDRLEADLPGVREGFGPGLDLARRAADLQLALDAWTAGEILQARRALGAHWRKSALAAVALAGTWLYPFALPAERLRRLKHGLAALWRGGRAPFRSHGSSTS